MNVGVVGGGMTGLAVAWEVLRQGHRPVVFEREPVPGGLSTWFEAEGVAWDRYYHCILSTDEDLQGLLQEAGLAESDLVIACTSRDEVNVVVGILAERLSPETRTIVRTQKVGRVRTASLDPRGLDVLERWIRDRRSILEKSLDRLGDLLAEGDGDPPA